MWGESKMWLELKYLEANKIRGFLSWMLGYGIFLYIDTCVDEIVERVTLIKRKSSNEP